MKYREYIESFPELKMYKQLGKIKELIEPSNRILEQIDKALALPSTPAKITTQQEREQILSKLLSELKAKQPDINLQSLPFSRADMLKMLEEYELFNGLSNSQFDKFFKAQKLCELRRGRPRK